MYKAKYVGFALSVNYTQNDFTLRVNDCITICKTYVSNYNFISHIENKNTYKSWKKCIRWEA